MHFAAYTQARSHSRKRHYLCFDEWNVWYRTQNAESVNGHGKFAQHLVEEEYNLEDALVVAGFLNSFIRHADIVKIANLAQIVNVIAPILTRGDQMLLQSIYYPFLIYAGAVMDGTAADCPGTWLRESRLWICARHRHECHPRREALHFPGKSTG